VRRRIARCAATKLAASKHTIINGKSTRIAGASGREPPTQVRSGEPIANIVPSEAYAEVTLATRLNGLMRRPVRLRCLRRTRVRSREGERSSTCNGEEAPRPDLRSLFRDGEGTRNGLCLTKNRKSKTFFLAGERETVMGAIDRSFDAGRPCHRTRRVDSPRAWPVEPVRVDTA